MKVHCFADAVSRRSHLPIYTQLTYLISNSIPYQPKIVAHIQDTESDQLKELLQVLKQIPENTMSSLDVRLSQTK